MSFGEAFQHLDYGSLLKSGYNAAEFGMIAGVGFGTSGLVAKLGWAGVRGLAAGAAADIGLGVVGDTASARMSFGEAVAANAIGFGLGEVAGAIGRRVLGRAGRALANQCSFSGDTTVATEDGDKPIREIKEGDEVLAYNEATGQTDEYEVSAVWSHLDPVTVYVTLDGEEIETTPEHPFYTKERGWVAAGELQVGDHVRDAAGAYGAVEAVRSEQRSQPMYNLTVEEAHTFFVGDGQWLVHNECGFSDLRRHARELRDLGLTLEERRWYLEPGTGAGKNKITDPRIIGSLPIGQVRTPAETRGARMWFKNYKEFAWELWERRSGVNWYLEPDGITRVRAEHPRPLADGGHPLDVYPDLVGSSNAPHNIVGPDGMTDAQRWGKRGTIERMRRRREGKP